MKVLIDIPNKYVEIVKGIMLGACKNEDEENVVHATADSVIKKENPIQIDVEGILCESVEKRANCAQILMGLASFAMVQVRSEHTEQDPKSTLAARLRSLQEQADELKRKIMEG